VGDLPGQPGPECQVPSATLRRPLRIYRIISQRVPLASLPLPSHTLSHRSDTGSPAVSIIDSKPPVRLVPSSAPRSPSGPSGNSSGLTGPWDPIPVFPGWTACVAHLRHGRSNTYLPIIGSMFAGKTTQLLPRVEPAKPAHLPCLVMKFDRDPRYASDSVATHDFQTHVAIHCQHFLSHLTTCLRYNLIGVDEDQFSAISSNSPTALQSRAKR
jgi:hypothetical protein